MRHSRTTGSSSVAIKTGSTYISDSMGDIITIPTSNLQSGRVCRIRQEATVTSMTTGNSDMANKAGNSYTTVTTINSVEIPTASQGFLTMANPSKVSPSDCDNVRQPKMVLRPLKPEILISLELWQVGWQFQRQTWGYRSCPARRNWPWAMVTTTDNRKWKYRRFGPKLAISGSRSLSKSFGYTFVHIVIIENLEFVVGISMLSVIVPEI